ncbi:hypothetical protein BDV25DRAFT_171877 [Aspergillus avenaceus]|uniref:Zn(2)-C6 fungal-type domain-containing protein n=1 Tax=Aspergillus avenaceus TaxID=36643 RepID=A0A5N6TX10_ASPAV|nr:hypothetical protein BDV25DRAFT_171877 [Aspergillus avenaceus]
MVSSCSVQRKHSGCMTCRKRGKKCDETKPRCKACTRLALECSYGVNFTFRNYSGAVFQKYVARPIESHQSAARPVLFTPDNACATTSNTAILDSFGPQYNCLPASINSEETIETSYLNHFENHVRHLLPGASSQFMNNVLDSSCLRYAALCIAASNLSMLNTRVQIREMAGDDQRSLCSPSVNHFHHLHAQIYHDQARHHCHVAEANSPDSISVILNTYTVLAYYHHASTDHKQFRLAVWDSVHFVLRNKERLMASSDGVNGLQMWYRLCMSHRLSKPPALLLEGEGHSCFGPNIFPDVNDQLHLVCLRSMSSDDLIYDILIKTIEIRTRLVVFRCVASSCQLSDMSKEIGTVAHEVMNRIMGRYSTADEEVEAQESFVRGSHLQGLLDVQRERLKVWRSMLNEDQLPAEYLLGLNTQNSTGHSSPMTFPAHRDTMNALYYLLCEMMYDESHPATIHDQPVKSPLLAIAANTICRIAGALDLNISKTSDVYTFSLTETLLQLVCLWQSDPVFHCIFDIIWPRLEAKARGYEHSHYPTHLVKRVIRQISEYWSHGRMVKLALPAVPENISKLKLLDIDHPIDLVVCGHTGEREYFIEKVPLC